MVSDSMTIDELCQAAFQTAEEKGFHPAEPPAPTTLEEALSQLQDARSQLRVARFFQRLFLIVSELVEAGEDWRKGAPADRNHPDSKNVGKPRGIPSEMADVFIRLGDVCEEYGIPITAAIREKMAFNATRPHMHGKVA